MISTAGQIVTVLLEAADPVAAAHDFRTLYLEADYKLKEATTYIEKTVPKYAFPLKLIGTPRIVPGIPTAQVRKGANGSTIMEFGLEFLATLNVPETAAIILHETQHYIWRHIRTMIRKKYNRLVWNWATDFVINELLFRTVPFVKKEAWKVLQQGIHEQTIFTMLRKEGYDPEKLFNMLLGNRKKWDVVADAVYTVLMDNIGDIVHGPFDTLDDAKKDAFAETVKKMLSL